MSTVFERFDDYVESDEEFDLRLRLELEWDDAAFEELLGLLREVVDAVAARQPAPAWLPTYFSNLGRWARSWVQHENFVAIHARQRGCSREEAAAHLAARLDALEPIREAFFAAWRRVGVEA